MANAFAALAFPNALPHLLFALAAFFLVHILMVLLAGPLNEIRAMITGRYRVPQDKSGERP